MDYKPRRYRSQLNPYETKQQRRERFPRLMKKIKLMFDAIEAQQIKRVSHEKTQPQQQV